MRILGLDYGDKTIGVAVSDLLRLMAHGVEVIPRRSPKKFDQEIKRLTQIISEYEISKIVIGMPKGLNNNCGPQCEKTLIFKEHLQELFPDIEIILWDERFSSVAAQKNLTSLGLNSFKQKKVIDKMAAVFFLQGYLDYLNLKEDI